MSNNDNKPIIKKSKEILTKFGYDVKTSHLYELFSQLVGHPDWNTASAKNAEFSEVLSNFKNVSNYDENKFPKNFLSDLNKGIYRDKIILGFNSENQTRIKNFKYFPNSLFSGAMGSGKSAAASFSILTWMLANSDQSILFIVDPIKEARDYSALMEKDSNGKKVYEQVYPIINSEKQIHNLIDLLFDEVIARKNEFNKVLAEDYEDYEKKTGKKISRILTIMEEFHIIPYSIMNFYPDFKVDLTTANKFHTLMKIGRSYGIWFIACTQKSTSSDIPSELVSNFKNKNVFRTSSSDSMYLLGNTKAASITPDKNGYSISDDEEEIHFPFLSTEEQVFLLKKYMKKQSSQSLYLNNDLILNTLNGKVSKDKYKYQKLEYLVKNIESYDAELVITLLHEKQGHRVEQLDSTINNFGISHIVHRNDSKVAVMTRCNSNSFKITEKDIGRLKKAMDFNECSHGIIYTSRTDLPNNLYKISAELGIEIFNHDDLINLEKKLNLEQY